MAHKIKNSSLTEFRIESEEFNSRAEKFKLIFNASPDMIFILSHTGLILDANDAALAGYGYDHDQVFGLSFEKLLANADYIKNARKLFDSVNKGAEIDYEWLTKTRTGKRIPVDIRLRSLKLDEQEEKSAVVLILRDISAKQKADEAINSLARASNLLKFQDFLNESVKSLAELYGTKFAFVGRLLPDNATVETMAVWAGESIVDNFSYALKDTPCQDVVDMQSAMIPSKACSLYPKDILLQQMNVESYFGVSMVAENKKKGLVVLLDDKPLVIEEWAEPILELFANRLAVEVERYDVTQALQKSKENLEELVEERTKELALANKDLEAFNSSIAHDLRTPINAISSYCQIIEAECKSKIDELSSEYINTIRHTADDMAELIENLLNLSRVSKSEVEKEEVNISALAQDIVEKLQYLYPEKNVVADIEENITVNADRGAMIVLLDNLLNNAWKYSSKQKQPKVSLAKYSTVDGNGFYIKDNGAGFDMGEADKLFAVFKRLHKEEDFPGTGVGLATVHRIVGKHGGEIWADAIINKGATFFISLPDE